MIFPVVKKKGQQTEIMSDHYKKQQRRKAERVKSDLSGSAALYTC